MIFAPPRHSKSLFTSKMFPSWYLGRNPDHQIICASYGGEMSTDFGRGVRDLLTEPEYRLAFPGTTLRPDSQAANRWNTQQGGVYVAAGIGGPITGRGAHVLVIDDPIKSREEADSELYRDRVWRWYTNDAYTRLMPNGAIVLIQTRWHEDDLAGRLLEQQEHGGDHWEVLSFPAIAEADTPHDPTGRAPGEALWPAWFSAEALRRIQAVQTVRDGPRAWSALYQQRPLPESGDFFKREWLRWYDQRPAHLRTYGASDYAVTADDGDYTVHLVVGVDPNDDLYVLDVWRHQTDSAAWVEAFCDLVGKWNPLTWAEESGQIAKAVGSFLEKRIQERRVYCRREQFTSSTDKPTRAQSIRGRMSMGKVYFPRSAPWTDDLVGELLRFPAGVHDDQVDAMSLIGRMLAEMYRGTIPVAGPGPDFQKAQDGNLTTTEAFVRQQLAQMARLQKEQRR